MLLVDVIIPCYMLKAVLSIEDLVGLLYFMTFYLPVRLGYYGLAEGVVSPGRGSRREQLRRGLKFFLSPAFLVYGVGVLFLGLQIMRTLARNMAFLIKSIQLGKATYGIPPKEPPEPTNFIR